jgi:hypothetical protein
MDHEEPEGDKVEIVADMVTYLNLRKRIEKEMHNVSQQKERRPV